MLWANPEDDKPIPFPTFFPEKRTWTIRMKCQIPPSGKKERKEVPRRNLYPARRVLKLLKSFFAMNLSTKQVLARYGQIQ